MMALAGERMCVETDSYSEHQTLDLHEEHRSLMRWSHCDSTMIQMTRLFATSSSAVAERHDSVLLPSA